MKMQKLSIVATKGLLSDWDREYQKEYSIIKKKQIFKRASSRGDRILRKILTGKYGEWLARRYLKKKGYRILHWNYKTPIGEIDIIAKDGNKVVFVEVKTRKNDSFGLPIEAINYRKRKKIVNSALLYMKRLKDSPAIRFDIISIHLHDNQKKVEHTIDAFEL